MLENYLNEDEEIERQWPLEEGKKTKEHKLVITNKRVIEFEERKRNEIRYRDCPLKNIKNLEHEWHGRNIPLLVLAGITFIVTWILLFLTGFSFLGWLISFPLFIIVIILLIKGLKQNGYLLINDEKWKYKFSSESDFNKIKFFIQYVYFIIE